MMVASRTVRVAESPSPGIMILNRHFGQSSRSSFLGSDEATSAGNGLSQDSGAILDVLKITIRREMTDHFYTRLVLQ